MCMMALTTELSPSLDQVPHGIEGAADIPAGLVGQVVVVDLRAGSRRVVAETRGWDTQTGAHVQWGGGDHELFYNDLDESLTQVTTN